MKKVFSKDGTPIAFDQSGQGPAVILVAGALGVRSHPIMVDLAFLYGLSSGAVLALEAASQLPIGNAG